MSKSTDPHGPLTATGALTVELARHAGENVTTRTVFGPWVCPCGETVGDRFGWLSHVSSKVGDLWSVGVSA